MNKTLISLGAFAQTSTRAYDPSAPKTRAEVKGSSKKLHKQKGTGGARKGNIRNPLYKGGGTVNGPLPHSYDFKLNRKVKDLAKMSALSIKAKENKIVIVEVPQNVKSASFHATAAPRVLW